MRLEEKIQDRKIAYFFRKDASIACELALLYFILAKRKNCRDKVAQASSQAIHWLKTAQFPLPEYLESLSCFGQLEEIEKILVKAKVDARAL